MSTNNVGGSTSSQPAAAAPPASGSPLRLIVLLGILIVAIGALGYDYYVAAPQCAEGDKNIHAMVEERNKQGVKDAALVTSPDVQKVLGRAPTLTKENDKDNYTVEYYCFWGNVPLLNMRRHFIAVVYVGNKPRRYSSHYREEPPAEAFPIVQTGDDAAEGEPDKDKQEGKTEPEASKDSDKKDDSKKEESKKDESKDDKQSATEADKGSKEGEKSKAEGDAKEGDKAAKEGTAQGDAERGIGFRGR